MRQIAAIEAHLVDPFLVTQALLPVSFLLHSQEWLYHSCGVQALLPLLFLLHSQEWLCHSCVVQALLPVLFLLHSQEWLCHCSVARHSCLRRFSRLPFSHS
jgi:hypothetical protein